MVKKMFQMFLVAAILLGLCACQNNSVNKTDKDQDFTLSGLSKSTPSQKQIMEDLEEIFAETGINFDFENVEIEKSRTSGENFYITLSILAQCDYADWDCELDLLYTMYDQGWVLDDTEWVQKNISLARFPDAETMAAYAREYLSNPKNYKYSDLYSAIWNYGAENPTVSHYTQEDGREILLYNWQTAEPHICWDTIWIVSSEWEYNANQDCWSLAPGTEPGNHYALEVFGKSRMYNYDYSGTYWLPVAEFIDGKIVEKDGIPITLYNFSWSSVDVELPDYNGTTRHFTKTHTSGYFGAEFSSEKGEYLQFKTDSTNECLYIFYTNESGRVYTITIEHNNFPLQQ